LVEEIRTAERALELLVGLERRLKQRDRKELEEHLGHLERLAESLPEAHPVRLFVESAVRSARTRGAGYAGSAASRSRSKSEGRLSLVELIEAEKAKLSPEALKLWEELDASLYMSPEEEHAFIKRREVEIIDRRAAPEGPKPRSKGHAGIPAHRVRDAHPGRAPAPGREAARASRVVAVVARPGGDDAGPGSHLALLRQAFRPGAHLPLPQTEHGMDHLSGKTPRTGRPVELAGRGRLHTQLRLARPRCGPEAAAGETLRRRSTDTGAGPSGSFVAFGGYGHASEGAETLR
jgi:hypothetical protein